jgi:hypothetical protein
MTTTTLDFANPSRDLTPALEVINQNSTSLLSLIGIGSPVALTKHEWTDDVLSPELDALGTTIDNDDTTVAVSDGTRFAAGMVITFPEHGECLRVTSVASNNLTVVRAYGGTTAAAHTAGDEIRIVSRPRHEATDPGDDGVTDPSVYYNQTEIFDLTAKVSRTAMSVQAPLDQGNPMDRAIMQHMAILQSRMNSAAIHGARVARSAGVEGSMGGILWWLRQSGTVTSGASGAAIDLDRIHDVMEVIMARGGRVNTLVCNTNQARRITALWGSKVQVLRTEMVTGNQILEVQQDIPGGGAARIVVDISFPKTAIALLDSSRISLRPLAHRLHDTGMLTIQLCSLFIGEEDGIAGSEFPPVLSEVKDL